ncbi:MAG: type II secretion system secretin GspD [Maricaulaceae bacterium]
MRRDRLIVGAALGLSLSACAGPLRGPDAMTTPPPPTETRDAPTGGSIRFGAETTEHEPLAAFERRGQGAIIGAPVASAQWRATPGGLRLNFQNARVGDIAAAVIGDALDLPYTVEPGVSDLPVTVQSSRPLAEEAVLFALEAAFAPIGVALSRTDGVVHLSPSGEDTPGGVFVSRTAVRAGYGVQIVPVRHIAPTRLMAPLEPLIPGRAEVSADAERNLLLISGAAPERAAVLDMAQVFDVDWLSGRSYGLYPLKSASAEDIVGELELLLDAGEGGLSEDIVQLTPVDRLNAVMVITNQDAYLDIVSGWITTLDRGGAGAGGRRLYLYAVEHGRAIDLAAVLGGLFDAQATDLTAAVGPGLNAQRNQTGRGGRAGATGRNGGGQAGTGLGGGAGAAAGQNRGQGRGQAGGGFDSFLASDPRQAAANQQTAFVGENLRIIADDQRNTLLILTTPDIYDIVERSLQQLDAPPLQVLIEATIAEVTLNDTLEFGVQFFLSDGDFDFTLSNLDTGAIGPAFPGFAGVFQGNEAQVVIDALDAVSNVEVVSSPQVMVLNNQTAVLQVGDDVPVATRSAVSVIDPGAPVVNNIEFRSTGVILRVTPRANASGLVQLDIEQEVSDVSSTLSSGIDSPTISQRRIESTVAVQSGSTIALGGLIEDSRNTTNSGFPGLRRIPVLGRLFETSSDIRERSELLVLIRPRVIGAQSEAQAATEELRRRMRTLEPLPARIGLE